MRTKNLDIIGFYFKELNFYYGFDSVRGDIRGDYFRDSYLDCRYLLLLENLWKKRTYKSQQYPISLNFYPFIKSKLGSSQDEI
jgi:hypothetical protein